MQHSSASEMLDSAVNANEKQIESAFSRSEKRLFWERLHQHFINWMNV